jgi:hypothetical protein
VLSGRGSKLELANCTSLFKVGVPSMLYFFYAAIITFIEERCQKEKEG